MDLIDLEQLTNDFIDNKIPIRIFNSDVVIINWSNNKYKMKRISEILNQKPVYLHNWKSKIDLISDFEYIYLSHDEFYSEKAPYKNIGLWEEKKQKMKIAVEKWKDINILFASYGQDNYLGDAFVLFEKEGSLFEVNANHCSCYGLEGQFKPEKTTIEEISYRLINGSFGTDNYSDNEFAVELKQFLGIS